MIYFNKKIKLNKGEPLFKLMNKNITLSSNVVEFGKFKAKDQKTQDWIDGLSKGYNSPGNIAKGGSGSSSRGSNSSTPDGKSNHEQPKVEVSNQIGNAANSTVSGEKVSGIITIGLDFNGALLFGISLEAGFVVDSELNIGVYFSKDTGVNGGDLSFGPLITVYESTTSNDLNIFDIAGNDNSVNYGFVTLDLGKGDSRSLGYSAGKPYTKYSFGYSLGIPFAVTTEHSNTKVAVLPIPLIK